MKRTEKSATRGINSIYLVLYSAISDFFQQLSILNIYYILGIILVIKNKKISAENTTYHL